MRKLIVALVLVAAPAFAKSKQVTCKDGTTSTAKAGACSHHGGVAPVTQDAAPSKAAPVPAASGVVYCKDGSTSKGGRGACSRHGGVANGAAPSKPQGSLWDRIRGKSSASSQTPDATQTPAAPPTERDSPPANQGRSARSTSRALPAGQPTATCKDGTTSYSQHHSGACSHHGGVAQWLR